MTGALAHRGPDGDGFYLEGPIGLGHRRLKVIDLTDAGQQPMASDDGNLVITFNGEIYNFQELRTDLEAKGHRFKSHTDTEVVLHLYQEEAVKCLTSLRGMFAFAIWDKQDRSLFLARDRVGKKPLVYAEKDGVFYFGSEVKALLQVASLTRSLDYEAILSYFLHLYVPYPLSIFHEIRKLPPGSYMVIADGKTSIHRYWIPDYGTKTSLGEEECREQFLTILDESVRLRMISDVPLGAFLSGGVDSSSIVAMMAKHSSSPIRTFSIGFELPGVPDPEFPYARAVARQFGTDHKEILVTQDLFRELPFFLQCFDEPFGTPAAPFHIVLAREMKKEVTVALSGDGGDEVFGGYNGYTRQKLLGIIYQIKESLPVRLVEMLAAWTGGLPLPEEFLAKMRRLGSSPADFRAEGTRVSASFYLNQLFSREVRHAMENFDYGEIYSRLYLECRAAHYLDGFMYGDLMYAHQFGVVAMADQSGMAHGLEIRAPYLDHKLVEFAASLPVNLKVRSVWRKHLNKYIVKKALECILPTENIYRRKMGFGYAIRYDRWLRKEWRGKAEKILFDGHLQGLDLFNMAFIRRLWEEFLTKRENHFRLLWSLLIFDLWSRVYLDREDPFVLDHL